MAWSIKGATSAVASATGLTGLDVTAAFSAAWWQRAWVEADDSILYQHWATNLEGVQLRGTTASGQLYGLRLRVADAASIVEGQSRSIFTARTQQGFGQGRWTHWAVVWDGARVVFYINGVAFDSVALVKTATTGGTRNTSIMGGGTGGVLGIVADLRVWSVALTPGDIQRVLRGARLGNERGIWCNRPTGVDESGNGNTVALAATGASRHVSLPNPGVFRALNQTSLTRLGRRRVVRAPVAAAGDTTLAAVATVSVSSAAALSTDITMAGSATVALTTAGALTTDISLAGSATVAVTTAAALTTDLTMAAAATVSITTSAGLATDIQMAGTATVSVTTVAALTTDIRMAAAASVVFSTAGDLEGTALLAAVATVAVTTAAALTTDIQMAGAATVSVTTAGALTTDIRMAASASVALTTAAALATDIPLAGSSTVALSTAGALATDIRLLSAATIQFTTMADLATAIQMAAAATVAFSATAVLEVGIPLSRWRLIDCSVPGFRVTDRSVPAYRVTDRGVPGYRLTDRS